MTVERPHKPKTAGEREMLLGFLEHHRATLAMKCDGLTAEQLAERAVPPSALSLLGLIRHMGEVEQGWFGHVHGEPVQPRYCSPTNEDGDFDDVRPDPQQVEDAYAYWHGEIEHARTVVAAHGLDDTFVHPRSGATHSLRWVLLHMVEEYARHCGHADLLRERIDGVTGY